MQVNDGNLCREKVRLLLQGKPDLENGDKLFLTRHGALWTIHRPREGGQLPDMQSEWMMVGAEQLITLINEELPGNLQIHETCHIHDHEDAAPVSKIGSLRIRQLEVELTLVENSN